MPSGKKSKQMRRVAAAPPPVRSKGATRGRQADPKIVGIVAGAVVLAIVAAVLALSLSGGKKAASKSFPAVGTLENALPAAGDVNALFKGIPQSGFTLGSPNAPVTMVEYIDLQCPICQAFETQVMPGIVKNYVRTKKVKVEVRVLDFIGPDSSRGRKAMIAMAAQNKAFNFAQLLYNNQGTENTGWLNDTIVGEAVSSVPGVQVHKVLSLQSAGSVTTEADTFDRESTAQKVGGTPTLFVGKTGLTGAQVVLSNPTDGRPLVTALDNALA